MLEPLGLGQRLASANNIGLDHFKRNLRLSTGRLAVAYTVRQFCAPEHGSSGSFAVLGRLCLSPRETPLVLCLCATRLERRRERRLGGQCGGCEAIFDTGVIGVGRQLGTLALCIHLHGGRSRRRRSGLVDEATSTNS